MTTLLRDHEFALAQTSEQGCGLVEGEFNPCCRLSHLNCAKLATLHVSDRKSTP